MAGYTWADRLPGTLIVTASVVWADDDAVGGQTWLAAPQPDTTTAGAAAPSSTRPAKLFTTPLPRSFTHAEGAGSA
jgi:hypothetical protein